MRPTPLLDRLNLSMHEMWMGVQERRRQSLGMALRLAGERHLTQPQIFRSDDPQGGNKGHRTPQEIACCYWVRLGFPGGNNLRMGLGGRERRARDDGRSQGFSRS